MESGRNTGNAGSDELELRPPSRPDEWDRYFDLRWRVLRAPWNQPRGSERDNLEENSRHIALWNSAGSPVAVGRVHLKSSVEAQVRYMAVEPGAEGSGLGGRILAGLEDAARKLGAARVVLNARERALPFYERHGYATTGPAETMFGEIRHICMSKALS